MGSDGFLQRAVSRRTFISTAAMGAAAISFAATCDPAMLRRIQQEKDGVPPKHHRAWVWQFSTDGNDPRQVAETLNNHGLGVLVKTHDGVDWMSKYDHSTSAVSGPAQIERLARIFENEGVPFHAWSVVKGVNPAVEAQMSADVLSAGARSLVLDLEGSSGFWVGSRDDALRFGDELRRLTPFGRVDISIDPRPWRIYLNVPMDEFVAITDAIWPQLYWETFDSQGNHDGYRNSGYPVGAGGMTPEFLLDTTWDILGKYEREIIPVGQGAVADTNDWARFTTRAWELGMGEVSVWRYGVTPAATIEYLGDSPAGSPPKPPRTPTPAAEPTNTARPTRTSRPTKTPTPTRTKTPTPTKTATPLNSATPTPTEVVATATSTPIP